MTPVYLNLTTPCDHDDHIFLSPFKNIDHGSSSCSTLINTTTTTTHHDHHGLSQHDEFKVYKWQDEESSDLQVFSSSSTNPTINDSVNGIRLPIVRGENGHHDNNINNNNNNNYNNTGLTVKWMSSKMRLMRKMMNSNSEQHKYQDQDQDQQQQEQEHGSAQMNYLANGSNGLIRVCSNCNTTKTPLWRGGPSGPKSLCNACGIRQRKARRAMEAATALKETIIDTTMRDTSSSSSSMKTTKITINKETKKMRTNYYVAKYKKKQCKLKDQNDVIFKNDNDQISTNKKNCFEDFALKLLSKNSSFRGVFSQDEEEGAILLMALSCGLV